MRIDPDMKASFTVHETADPSWIEIHRLVPNVKSLRVPETRSRAFPADRPHVRRIVTARLSPGEYRAAVEEFPAYGWVLLRLAGFPLDLRTVLDLLLIDDSLSRDGHGHLCRALHVTMQNGLSHPRLQGTVRHTVSEDFRTLWSGLSC
jgi:hypothetical protein